MKTVKKTEPNLSKQDAPSAFLSDEAKTAKKLRRHLERRWKYSNLELDHIEYRNQCRKTNDLINESRDVYLQSKYNDLPKNGKEKWNAVKKLLHTQNKDNYSDLPPNFCVKIANCFIDKVTRLKFMIGSTIGNSTCIASNLIHLTMAISYILLLILLLIRLST